MFHGMFTCHLLTDCITLVCTVFNNIVVTNCRGGTNHGSKGNKRWRKPKGHSRMDNPEKLATLGTQDEDKQKTDHHTRYVLNAITRQTNTNNVINNKQLEVKTIENAYWYFIFFTLPYVKCLYCHDQAILYLWFTF